MTRGSIFQYALILLLVIAVISLYVYYNRVRSEKAAIIQIASNYPYSRYDLTFDRYNFNLCTISSHNFFPDSALLVKLSDHLMESQSIHEVFLKSLGNFEEEMWSKKVSSIEFYETWLSIPDRYITKFYQSNQEYINTFRMVLRQTDWKPTIMWHGRLVSDSVHLNLGASLIALDRFEKIFLPDNKILIDDRIFDLKHLTRFEFFVLLEQITWLREAVESNYRNTVHEPINRWMNTLMKIEIEEIHKLK